MLRLAVYGLTAWALYTTWNGQYAALWWLLLACTVLLKMTATAVRMADRLAKENYAERTGFPIEVVSTHPLPLSEYGDQRSFAMRSIGLNVALTILVLVLSGVLIYVN